MKKIFRPFLILAGIVSLLFAIPNHQGIDRSHALSPFINQSIAEFVDTGKNVQSTEKFLITFVTDTKYYIIAPDPDPKSYKLILKETASTADFSYDYTFDVIFNPVDSTCSFIDKNFRFLSAVGDELCLSNLNVNPNNQFYLPNSNHESLKNVTNGLSISVIPLLSTIMLIDENDASNTHNLNLHFFMYKKFETKSSISFSYTYDGRYIFNGVPDLSFGAKIPLRKYEELISDESNKPIFGVVLTTEIRDGSSLDELEDMLAFELIIEDVPFDTYKRYKNIICTPARVDFNGFEDEFGNYYQWGVTIQNYGQSQDMIFGECGISVFPYIIYKGKVAFATPRERYTARDCVDLYLNDPVFDEYKTLLNELNMYLMECYAGL